jgi:hypothetical protein
MSSRVDSRHRELDRRLLYWQCPLLALSGHVDHACECPEELGDRGDVFSLVLLLMVT